jgi:hypothetical protein
VQGAIHRFEDVLEAAAGGTDGGHAGELVGERDADGQVVGVRDLIIVDEVEAARGWLALGAVRDAERLELRALAADLAAAVDLIPGAEIAGDDAEVIVGRMARRGRVVEDLEQLGKARFQLIDLWQWAGRRIVQHEEDVDLVDGRGRCVQVRHVQVRHGCRQVFAAGGEQADRCDQVAHSS